MKTKPLYIFDLDGTLALIDHRKHILDEVDDRQRWRRFYAACDEDQPNIPIVSILETLRHAGCDVWIFSGRSDEVRDKTVKWLTEHTSFMSRDLDTALVMRRAGDYTADDKLKQRWLNGLLPDDRSRLKAVFEDRDRVVAMWRENGVACLQVAAGDF